MMKNLLYHSMLSDIWAVLETFNQIVRVYNMELLPFVQPDTLKDQSPLPFRCGIIVMPRCACASEVYGSVCACTYCRGDSAHALQITQNMGIRTTNVKP